MAPQKRWTFISSISCGRLESLLSQAGWRGMAEIWRSPFNYVKAPMPVMARPTMSVCMVSVPSKVWIASRSAMCRAT